QGTDSRRTGPEQAPAPGRQPAYGASDGNRYQDRRNPPAAREGAPAPQPSAGDRNAPQASSNTHEGTFLSLSNGKLEMTDPEHGKHSHQLSPDTKVFIDGQQAKAEDLKADMKLKITTQKDDPQKVIRIDAQGQNKNGAQRQNGAQPRN